MTTEEEIVVVVPVREGSTRIKNKNFRPFGGYDTILENKLEQLKAANCFNHIYVSSDSEKAKEITKKTGAEYLPRDPHMCTSIPRWDEVVVHVMETIPGNPIVAWAMATSPLFTRYSDAVKEYFNSMEQGHDSLVGVKTVNEYLIDESGRPLFFGYGPWHPYTTEFKPMYAINDVIFIAPKELQIKYRYWFGRKPKLFDCGTLESIDVNYQQDLELAYAAEKVISRNQK